MVTMRPGPGHIEARLLQLFSNQPGAILTTAEICRRVYEKTQVDKKPGLRYSEH
jgi:DNA-binding response OmpR family regulator